MVMTNIICVAAGLALGDKVADVMIEYVVHPLKKKVREMRKES